MQKSEDSGTFFSFLLLSKFNSNFDICIRGYFLVFSKVNLAAEALESNLADSVEVKEPATNSISPHSTIG